MNQQAPKWFLLLFNFVVVAGLWLLCGWILTWAWYLSLHGIFGVTQISYGQALGLIALLAVAGGVVFRVIPAILNAIFYSGVHVVQTPPSPTPQQMQQVDYALQGLQQLMQQANQQPIQQTPAVAQKDPPKPPVVAKPAEPKPNPLKLKGGPTEWDE